MKFLTDTAFVLKRTNIGEADKFITIFTRNNGKQELVARGIRKITSKRASHVELLNEIKFQAVKTRKNFILTEIQVVNSFSNLKDDKSAIGLLFLICELIDKLCPLNQRHDDVYDLIKKTLNHLENENTSSVVQAFETKLLSSLGFWDLRQDFNDREDIERFIERIIEKKLKSKSYLNLKN
jgi:DNA repair protein RecO (recombination protein O)